MLFDRHGKPNAPEDPPYYTCKKNMLRSLCIPTNSHGLRTHARANQGFLCSVGHAGPRLCDCLARWLPGPCWGGVLADCLRLLGALGVTRPPWAMLGGRILETLCKSGPRRSAGAGVLETLCRIGPGHSPAATVSRFWAPRAAGQGEPDLKEKFGARIPFASLY